VNLTDVIEGLVEERGLDREQITAIVCEGIAASYEKKYPDIIFSVIFNKKSGKLEVFSEKEVVATVSDPEIEISVRRAKAFDTKADIGDFVYVPFDEAIGRIEILAAKQFIAGRIRSLEQLAVYEEYKDKQGTIVTGVIHKRERAGFAVKIGDVMALLPQENFVPGENVRVGFNIKALLSEVLQTARSDYQLILDRASADFVKMLIELEIPEVFEGVVEVKKIVRRPGYKTKAIVFSTSKDIDPVGTCVGVGGARIKPILRELGQEKIDLIEFTDSLEHLVKNSLKPAEIDKVEMEGDTRAVVWLAQDQRSLAIGKQGQNISLASQLTGVNIQLQDLVKPGQQSHNNDDDFQINPDIETRVSGNDQAEFDVEIQEDEESSDMEN
jgi:N utilization substance protein A